MTSTTVVEARHGVAAEAARPSRRASALHVFLIVIDPASGCRRSCGRSSPRCGRTPTRPQHGYVSWPQHFNFNNFTNAYTQSDMPHYFWNSIIVAIPAIFLILLFSSAVAFVVSRFSYWFNVPLLIFFMAANLLPQQVILQPLYRLYLEMPLPTWLSDSGYLYDSYVGLIADQRRVPDRLLHLRARQLHEDDPEVADRGGAGRRGRRPAAVLPDHPAALQAGPRCARDARVHVHLQRLPLAADPDPERQQAPDHGGAEQPPGRVLHGQQPARGGGAHDRDPDRARVRRSSRSTSSTGSRSGRPRNDADRLHRRRQRRVHEEPARRHPRASRRCARSRSRSTTSTPSRLETAEAMARLRRGRAGREPDDHARTSTGAPRSTARTSSSTWCRSAATRRRCATSRSRRATGCARRSATRSGSAASSARCEPPTTCSRSGTSWPSSARPRPGSSTTRTRWPRSASSSTRARRPTNVVGLCHSVQFTIEDALRARRRARERGHVPLGRHQPPGVHPALRARRREPLPAARRADRRRSGAAAPRARRALPAARLLPDRVERARRRVRAVVHGPRRRDRALPDPGRRVHPPQRGEPRRVRARDATRSRRARRSSSSARTSTRPRSSTRSSPASRR